MPFAANYMEEEEKKNQAQQSGAGVNISGGPPVNYATGIPGQNAGSDSERLNFL